jgi:hypothetical protein
MRFRGTGFGCRNGRSSASAPPGIDVDPSSGEILGTPTTAGSYFVLITVTDTASPPVQVSGTYGIEIN